MGIRYLQYIIRFTERFYTCNLDFEDFKKATELMVNEGTSLVEETEIRKNAHYILGMYYEFQLFLFI